MCPPPEASTTRVRSGSLPVGTQRWVAEAGMSTWSPCPTSSVPKTDSNTALPDSM